MTRICEVDTLVDREIVTKMPVGECRGVVESFTFEFSSSGAFSRLLMRCPRCDSQWTEHREFRHDDLDLIA